VEKKSFQVPREDGGVLVDPPLDQLPALPETNSQSLTDVNHSVAGKDFQELRSSARRGLLEAARGYMQEHGLTVPDTPHGPIILTGHQPAFYHPGVWFKNFLTSWLAGKVGGVPVNMVVDNDEARKPGFEVPVQGNGKCERVQVSLGSSRPNHPYEEWQLPDLGAAEAAMEQGLSLIERDDMRAAFNGFSRELLEAACEYRDMATFMTVARHRYETEFGLANLEIPLSRVCELKEFGYFFAHLLAELPRFRRCYNQALGLYRKTHRIRNQANPLPDLAERDGRLEAPFWVWREGEARRALYVGLRDGGRILLDGDDEILSIGGEGLADGERVAEHLVGLRAQGFKIRTRALTTTLFARMFLCDVFIHGTGGGNYDQITDEIIRTFLGVEPPGYIVASATVCLPFAGRVVPSEEVTRLQYLIRDLHYNPDRHLPPELKDDAVVRELVKRKWELIGRRGRTSLERRRIFVTIRRINAELKARLGDAPEKAVEALAQARADREANAVLNSRDYAFCLYPRELLQAFYGKVLP